MVQWIWVGVAGAVLGLAGGAACAQTEASKLLGVYIEGGRSSGGNSKADAGTVGFTIPFGRPDYFFGGAVTSFGDLFLSEWRAPAPSGERRLPYTQIGAIATWRYRFDRGASPWFLDGGIGVSSMNHLYSTPDRSFSTRFQFTEVFGIGRTFGSTGAHELSLRLQHFSNAGIKKPNPGENFVRLRYQYYF